MQSFDKEIKLKKPRAQLWVAFFIGGILLLLSLAPRQLAAQSTQFLPASDSSKIWLEVVADGGQQFRVRGHFLNQKNYPRYLLWRSQTVRGFEKNQARGDFVALENEETLVFEHLFEIDSNELRVFDFYVLDNDLIVGKAVLKFEDIRSLLVKKAADLAKLAQEIVDLEVKMPDKPTDFIENKPTESPVFSENKTELKPDSVAQNSKLIAVETPKIAPKTTDGKPFLAKDDFEIDGILTNEVRTNFGRQFWASFQENWQPPEKIGGYWISIKEILTPGRFTIISVSLNNRELFQRYLTPNPDYLKDLAAQTADYLLQLLKNGDPDGGFTSEDLNGIGIEN